MKGIHGILKRWVMEENAVLAAMRRDYPLTERELEVAHLVSLGGRNKEIAAVLILSEGTVKKYVRGARRKLNLPDRIALALACQGQATFKNPPDREVRFTPREEQIARLLARGVSSSRQIGEELGVLSEATIRNHVCRIMQKLGVSTRLEAAILLHRMGYGREQSRES